MHHLILAYLLTISFQSTAESSCTFLNAIFYNAVNYKKKRIVMDMVTEIIILMVIYKIGWAYFNCFTYIETILSFFLYNELTTLWIIC